MTDQPGDVLDEAVKLFEVLRRRISASSAGGPRPAPGDVWGQATYDEPTPHIATGAPECQYCPVCRAIAAARTSGPGIADQMMDVGQSLYMVVREALEAFDRPHPHTTPEPGHATRTPSGPEEERSRDFRDRT
jgi:hypothetical protein